MQKTPICGGNTPVEYRTKAELKRIFQQFKEKKDMDKKSIPEFISVIFKAIALAMGVAVVALSCLGSLEVQTAITLLGLGLACAGAAMLEKH